MDMKCCSKVIGALLAMTLCMPLYAGKVYKWQDENGSWHYSEKPPLEGEPETIKLKTKAPESTEDESSEGMKSNQEAPVTEEEEKNKKPLKKSPEILAAEQAQRAKNCEIARKNLDSLTHRAHIRYDDEEKGEQRYLTEEEHQEWLKKSAAQVEEFCD